MTAFENLFTVLTSPIFIIFFIIIIGYYIGKIQIRGISLDLAGVLIIAILSGAVLSTAFPESAILTDAFQENNKIPFLSGNVTFCFYHWNILRVYLVVLYKANLPEIFSDGNYCCYNWISNFRCDWSDR